MIDGRHPYNNINPCEDCGSADKVLNEFWDIAERLKVQPFLCFGTCLGFVRDGGYITNDNDIDVGILGSLDELTAELVKAEFTPRRLYGNNRHFLKSGILLDIWYKFGDMKYLQSFEKVDYKGRAYEVPCPVNEYLKTRYGDWKIKKLRKAWEG